MSDRVNTKQQVLYFLSRYIVNHHNRSYIVASTTEEGSISTFSYCVPKERETLNFYRLFIGMELRKSRSEDIFFSEFLINQRLNEPFYSFMYFRANYFGKCNGQYCLSILDITYRYILLILYVKYWCVYRFSL